MRLYLFVIIVLLSVTKLYSKPTHLISGKIVNENNQPIEFATIYIKETKFNTTSNESGKYLLQIPSGKYTLCVSFVGYKTHQQDIIINKESTNIYNIVLYNNSTNLNEVVVTASAVEIIKGSAFNAVAIDAKKMHNNTSDISNALAKLPGIKVRESGGVGSDMQFSLDGFTGKHIKIFIDGIPQSGSASFSLNNIPITFADRIEVYRGVVPVGFGADAIGGVINIVTGKKRELFIDASASYGSFDTYKWNVNFGQKLKNGIYYEFNAFQNYSGNNYKIETPVKDLQNGQIDNSKKEKVTRFHDTYHNEAIIAKIGLTGKSYADNLSLGITLSSSNKEIQNGVRQEIVFGDKRKKEKGATAILEFKKNNFLTKGLILQLNGSYNYNMIHNLDTSTFIYNWRGEKKYNNGKIGEQNYQDIKYSNDNWSGVINASYNFLEKHQLILNNVISAFTRKTQSSAGSADNSAIAASFNKTSAKSITGLQYRYALSNKFNISLFGKLYIQNSTGPRNSSTTGGFDYVQFNESINAFGYGAASSYFFNKNLQIKFSYEKALRLPSIDELFGDDDLEMGAIGLKPENSNNLNTSLSYSLAIGKNTFFIDGGFIYRNTKDYIKRTINSYSGGLFYGLYENHGKVETKGANLELRYGFSNWLNIGGNISYLDIRDKEKYVGGNTLQESTTYNIRIPNTPYFFINSDISFTIPSLIKKENKLNIIYSNMYVHQFPLYWENHGNKQDKQRVPSQFSNNISMVYSLKNGKYNFSIECINIFDEMLYDNYSLQKPGRAFYGKFRFFFGKN